ncbi:MAG: glycoside hydrolase family 9 protein [Anaerocolumna sp.]
MRTKMFKKCIVGMLILSLIINLGTVTPTQAAAISTDEGVTKEAYNYAKAFQLSMYFYDTNKCGPGVENGELSWRSDCHLEDRYIPLTPVNSSGKGTNLSTDFIAKNKAVLDPDGNGCVDLSGGFHDAGDHVKFGLPQSYSGSTLGWGYYEFKDAYVKIGAQAHIEDILRWFNDYFLRCTFRDADGNVVAFAYQVGDGTTDHTYWGSPELQTTARPAWFASSETPASDQCAGAAASLAINYLNFKESDLAYANTCLDTAKALYEFAKANRGLGYSGGFYNSSYDEDELSWAAVWLNIATGEASYINDIVSVDAAGRYTGYMKKIISTTDSTWQNIWVHSWDTIWGGVFAKLAPITNNPEHWYFFRWNIEYWSGVAHEDSNDTNYMAATPGGFRVINTWGSARYNTAAQLCALVYNKYKPNQAFALWCKEQMDYILGDNPMNRCYEVGYADNSAVNPHHRAAHGSLTNSMLEPAAEKHVLWGALVGGPDTEDYHNDVITDYVYNEVAIDYNAGFVGALAALYSIYGEGQEPDPTVPTYQVDEMPYYVESKIEQENSERTQLTIKITNDTSCPPTKASTLKARYFFDISEMIAKGQSIDDLSVPVYYDQALTEDGIGVKINGPFAWDEAKGIYYVDLDWSGISFHGSREIQIGFVPAQDASYKVNWDPTNDWSRQGLTTTMGVTSYIPLYLGDTLAYGQEPGVSGKVDVNITSPADNTVIDYTESQTPVEITATAGSNLNQIAKVEFYADGVKIGEDAAAPYTYNYTPADSTGNIFRKNIALTAKAISTAGASASSSTVNLTVIFMNAEESVIAITQPLEGTLLDTTAGFNTLNVIAQSTGVSDDITKIEIFADGNKIGEAAGDICNALYTAPRDTTTLPNGIIDVELTAQATLMNGDVKLSIPVDIKVKLPRAETGAGDLVLEMENNGTSVSNTISKKFTLSNTGDNSIDLSTVKIRYYYTKEADVKQVFYCDDAGMSFNTAPWYEIVIGNIAGEFVSLNPKVEGADTYLEISLVNLDNPLAPGKTLNCQFRITNADWYDYNQENDYSYANGNTVVLISNGTVVSGIIPQ